MQPFADGDHIERLIGVGKALNATEKMAVLDQALVGRIKAALRQEISPRHVPDAIYAIDEVPYTLSGKKLEVPIRRKV